MKVAVSLLSIALFVGCSSALRVSDQRIVADFTKGVSDICPLHHKRMKKISANVIFTFPDASRIPALAEYDAAQKAFFPFGETVYTTTDKNFPSTEQRDGPDLVRLYLCEDCQAAGDAYRDEWRYGKKKG